MAEDRLLGLLAVLIGASLLLLLLLFLLFILARRRQWRFFSPVLFSPDRLPITEADLEKPFLSGDFGNVRGKTEVLARTNISEESSLQIDRNINSPRTHGPSSVQRHLSKGDNLVADVISDASEDLFAIQTLKHTEVESWPAVGIGQTLKHTDITNWPTDIKNTRREEANFDLELFSGIGSSLSLEVISGPSNGLQFSRQSTNTSTLPLILGRISPSDLVLDDPGVSGKHAVINWNKNTLKWELVDMGSLNGTLLNSQAVHYSDLGGRRWSSPFELADGDTITLGSSSKIFVRIMPYAEHPLPFRVGVASDPMKLRQGGKSLLMEDVCYCQWPLPGIEQFGLFGIFDGHGGIGAAKAASEILPKMVCNILSNPEKREWVLSFCDASEVLRESFFQTEAAMKHQYEGSTATVLLVWANSDKEFFAQCANVGDSACVMNIGGADIKMTEDHRLSSLSEQIRLKESGRPLEDGQARLHGFNIGRMLGDKFLKEQDSRFSSEPYVSQVVHISRETTDFALMASDGLWDVISTKRAVQLALQIKARNSKLKLNSAEGVANFVLDEARTLRTKDNTSVIFLDFETLSL